MDLQLHVSPRLQQTIHAATITQLNILQMSQQELIDHVNDQLHLNPFIELEMSQERAPFKRGTTQDIAFQQIDNQANGQPSISELIMEQLLEKAKQLKGQWPILLHLVEQLDARLFLKVNIAFVAKKFQVDEAVVQRVISELQQLEPFGIAMEGPKQFLLAQLKRDPQATTLAQSLIEHHLEDLAKKKYRSLAKKYDCSVTQIEQAVKYIQSFSLYPQIQESNDLAPPLIPDAYIERLGDEWVIEMEQRVIPRVTLNEYYLQLVQQQRWQDENAITSMQEAAILIQGLTARQQTLYKVLEKVIAHQRDFLQYGADYLLPLTLSEVSLMTGLHESTISRAIREKYIQTPLGIFPIRMLFKKGVRQSNEEVTAVHTIQKKIEQLIVNEDRLKPLSDNQLVQLLKADGTNISRRTVTKYREALRIPNSYERIRTIEE